MIRRELGFFILNGSVSVILAYLIYRALISEGVLGINWANGFAYICGMTYGFFSNRKWAFQDGRLVTRKILILYVSLYAFTLFVNVFVNLIMLQLIHGMHGDIFLSFLAAISISTILNFLGLKYFVFNPNSKATDDLRKSRKFL
jgi:putative flippase GtrA